jgi:hypothetical protein
MTFDVIIDEQSASAATCLLCCHLSFGDGSVSSSLYAGVSVLGECNT